MSVSGAAMLEKLWALQGQLTDAGIDHSLTIYRDDAVSLIANLPDERWEIDVCEDGSIDFEVFKSLPMQGEAELQAAIAKAKLENEE